MSRTEKRKDDQAEMRKIYRTNANRQVSAAVEAANNNNNSGVDGPHLTWTQQVNIVIVLVLVYYKADIFVAWSAVGNICTYKLTYIGEAQQIRRPEDARSM